MNARNDDCGPLNPESLVPHIRKYAGRKMSDVPKGFWRFMWDKAGYGSFGQRRGWSGRISDYMEAHCGFWQEPRPEWAYEQPNPHLNPAPYDVTTGAQSK